MIQIFNFYYSATYSSVVIYMLLNKIITFKTEHYNKTEYKQRHNIMRPLKNATFKFSQIRKFGFNVSRKLWKSCTNKRLRNLGKNQMIFKSF